MLKAFCNATVFTGEKKLNKHVLINEGRIEAVVNEIPSEAIIVDLNGKYILPGLLDLQIYGGGGYLFSNAPSPEALHSITKALTKSGTTGFLLTLATNSIELFMQAIDVVKNNPHDAVLGLHLEGPYINPIKKGAHLQQYIKKPERKEVEALLKAADGVIKMMTLAPEMCDDAIIHLLRDHGVIVSAGHSNATFEEAQHGFDQGITATTHLFNAMSSFHHRDTGLPGATMLNTNVHASIIADGIHVDHPTLQIAKKALQDRCFLITDAVEENLEGAYVHVAKEDRFTLPDGTLSGSRLTMPKAIKNCIDHAGIDIEEAIRMATLYPARVMHYKDRGVMQKGARADLVITDDQLNVLDVYINGESIQ